MALEGTDLLVVQKQTGQNEMRSLTVSALSSFISNDQPITFKGTADATDASEQPDAAGQQDGFLYINNATAAGNFAWTAGTAPFTGTVYPNANVIWQSPTGWTVTNNTPGVNVGVTAVQGSAPITVNSADASAPIVGVNDATTSSTGVVQVATDADVTAGTLGVVVTAAQLKTTNDAIANSGAGTVTEVTGVAPIVVANGATTPAISVTAASTSDAGVVVLEDASALAITSTTTAATPKYVDDFYLIKNFSTLPSVDS